MPRPSFKRPTFRGFLWLFFCLGFILSIVVLVPEDLALDAPSELPETERQTISRFVVPEPNQRVHSSPFARPFLFELAGNDKINSLRREQDAKRRYRDILANLKPNQTPRVEVRDDSGITTLTIGGKPFLTVLPEDCPEYYGRLSPEDKHLLEIEVAHTWREVLQEDLMLRSFQLQRGYLDLYNYLFVVLFFLFGLIHLSVDYLARKFFRHPAWSFKTFLWLGYLWLLAAMNPSFDDVANFLRQGALRPLTLFIGCSALVTVAIQLTNLVLLWYYRILDDLDSENSLRSRQRRLTIKQASAFAVRLFWLLVGVISYLYLLGADLGAFFAGAGLFGVAAGFLGRDILLDFFYGINVIAEDQYGVGDWIETDQELGEVVNFSLRATQIRKVDGSLMTIPNSDLRRVKNHSNEWSQVDYQVTVSYLTDTDLAIKALHEEAQTLMREFPDDILEEPTPLGVHELNLNGVVLRLQIKTAPLAQWRTRRELNRRLKLRFEREGIDFAATRHRVHLIGASDQTLEVSDSNESNR